MAKAVNQLPSSLPADSEGFTLAERLFAAHWNPKRGTTDGHLAMLCLEAAEAFERVKHEGRKSAAA